VRADAALAAGLWVVQITVPAVIAVEWGLPTDPWWPLWAAVTLTPVVIRRRWLWTAVGLDLVFIATGVLYIPFWSSQGVALWVLVYTLATSQPWWRAIVGNAMLWLADAVAIVAAYENGWMERAAGQPVVSLPTAIGINLVIFVVTFMLGRTVRARREAAAALGERAAVAEAGRQAHAEQAVAEERRRIARELHDVVAHHVSVIGVMATGAKRVLKIDPESAEQALGTIEQTSRTTLRELRRLLFLLRVESDADTQLSPQPGLEGIRTLIDQVREAGLPATLRVDGEELDLEPGVALTAYRIVQEALTNTLKHAGQATAEVRLTFGPQLLTIEVFDTGAGPKGSDSAGHGLLGMRERVAVYGGTLRTGPRPGGGFRVYAKIPVETQDQQDQVGAVV